MAKFNTAQTIATMIETADSANESLENEMATLVEEFGETPLRPMKNGGINGNAFREGSKLETQQADADRIGLSLEKAQSLAAIRAALNAHRPTLYQTYQIAYFGLEAIKPTKPKAAPSEESLERQAKVDERAARKASAKTLRTKAKIASANATIAAASGDKDKQGEFKREAETLKASAKQDDAVAKAITEELTEAKEGNTRLRLLSNLVELRDAIKNAKVIDGEINAMTVGDLIDYLALPLS